MAAKLLNRPTQDAPSVRVELVETHLKCSSCDA
jgi:hypothetical protein